MAANVNGPASVGERVRNSSAWESSSLAVSDTRDFASVVIPGEATSLSIRRVDTPSREQVATPLVRARPARLRRSSSHSRKWVP